MYTPILYIETDINTDTDTDIHIDSRGYCGGVSGGVFKDPSIPSFPANKRPG